MTVYNDTLTDDVTASENFGIITQYTEFLENLTVAESLVSLVITNIFEQVNVLDTLNSVGVFNVSGVDIFALSDLSAILWQSSILDDITVDEPLSSIIHRIQLVNELVNIYDSSSSTGVLNAAIAVVLTLKDILGDKDITAILENIQLQDTFSEVLVLALAVVEDVTVDDINSTGVSFFVLVADDTGVEDTLTSQADLFNYVADGWVVTTSFIYDNQVYSGWVMNPENYAISTYTNYAFNSATSVFNTVLLANATGVYEMGGATDAGSYINAKIKTAAMTFGSTSQKQIPEVLLGVNNSGKVILTVAVDGQWTTTYELQKPSANLGTQQIKIGKGLHGRYWQFELITKENSTFDLDTFEFMPIVFGRKLR
ncbi:MAG: hypothetical protein KJO69_08185 [Gammaproteobacteria bacterium]|nr:hypothetical protein [Gammaproteobacteria bacterium]